MANKYEIQHQFIGSLEDIQAAVRYALRRIAKKNVKWSSDRRLIFNAPISFLSWGEKVIIDIEVDGNVKVFSKCICQLHDWGKNQNNVNVLLDWMEEYFELKR